VQLLTPQRHNRAHLARQIGARKEGSLWQAAGVYEQLQTLVQLAEHKVGEKGNVVLALVKKKM